MIFNTVSRTDREAARWVAEQQAGVLDAADAARLDAWLQVSANAEAFARAERLWEDMGAAVVRDAPAQSVVQSVRRDRRSSPSMRQARLWAPIAATGLAAALALAFLGLDIPIRIKADAMTAPGEQRTLTLDDGSIIRLNTDSAVELAYQPERRTVRLLRGEAAFTVAPDADRPFTVEAGGGSTTALGTQFIVRRRGALTQVSVTEHSVRAASRPGSVVVPENQTATYGPHQAPTAPKPSPIGVDAWTDGWLVFEDQPLSQVVEEIARYSPTPITVIGQPVRNRRVSGAFRIDPGSAVHAPARRRRRHPQLTRSKLFSDRTVPVLASRASILGEPFSFA
jgi:transmembrane sensor